MIIDVVGTLADQPNLDDAGIRWEDGAIVGHPLGLAALEAQRQDDDDPSDFEAFLRMARRAFVNPEIFVDFLPLEEWRDLQDDSED